MDCFRLTGAGWPRSIRQEPARTVSALHVMDPTAPLNVTGLPGLTLRFGTSSDGLPIGAQIVAPWMAESTLLHLASLLEAVSPVRGLRPDVSKLSSIVDPPSLRRE
ncbi:amidase family protein [Burkholderia gladioli]|uniref:amidase family protein n=1 Tax=Burkholderia gladioli TaxID=28095 RepID=UPI002AB0FD4B|nr:amidase family protein [Burkholderia gladioli]